MKEIKNHYLSILKNRNPNMEFEIKVEEEPNSENFKFYLDVREKGE